MRPRCSIVVVALAIALVAGCTTTPEPPLVIRGQMPMPNGVLAANADEKKAEAKGDDKKDEGQPKTIFEWAIGVEPPKKEAEAGEEDVIVTDRPDFTEASSTVGRGRMQLEAGYTYYRDNFNGTKRVDQTYPEILLRLGLFADWFELRLGQTYSRSKSKLFGEEAESIGGFDDFYLGTKLGLTEQKTFLPEVALILQAKIPTGAKALTADRVLPGFNLLYGWDVIPDCLSFGGSTQLNRAVDDEQHSYGEWAQSFTIGYSLTEKLGAYTEWFAFFPSGAIAPDVTAQHYFDGGFTYKVTPLFQLDIRVGFGLNKHSDDFFAGTGFAVKY
ncbi:MAG: transporter [Gemmataceae bacterium]|nr:transporter [Gemmataceae bacterium]